MNELFGISMTTIALVCALVTVAIFLFVGAIAVRNPVMFKTGLRNIPRRPAQTTLIIVGLMLSTLIITAAFGTGDTLTYSVTNEVYKQLDQADELITWDTEKQPAPEEDRVIPAEFVDSIRAEFADNPNIEAFVPVVTEPMPLFNTRSGLNDPEGFVSGFHTADLQPFGGLVDLDGNPVELAGNQIAVNDDLAEELDAQPGDELTGFYEGEPIVLVVAAIVPSNVFGGVQGEAITKGGTVDIGFLRELTGKSDVYDNIFVSNTGDTRSGMELSEEVTAELEVYLADTPFQVIEVKRNGVELAELLGNVFTTFFVVLGLFSIAAGVLLIFLIFVMLAAERKPEMGMARAVGARRSQIVESFLAEGMGYDLGAAVIGLFAGMGVTYLMVAIVSSVGGAALGLDLTVSFSWRGLLTAFCLGIIATFLVIFIASWRASRLNIVSAIRDTPEAKPINAESATWFGLLRATLNAFAALGFFAVSLLVTLRYPSIAPIAGLGMILGLVGPFFYVLRGHNFAAPRHERLEGERIPLWPFFTILAIPFYLAALLLVRITRDRKPARMPGWLIFAGTIVMPLGLVLVALQNRKTHIAWAAGLGTMAAVLSVLLIDWGVDANAAFPFLLGLSLIIFWFAILMRYFQVAERLAFTACGIVLLIAWFLPADAYAAVFGELEGDIEMFFLSGLVMITAGVFVVVYNADIILPLVERFGSRFGRIVPALKTGVAYPLTSRFRTGMTMSMIGLITFALIVISVMNTNFAQVFLNDDTKGGFDVWVQANANNPIDDINQPIAAAGLDPADIEGSGQVFTAGPGEADISNIDGLGERNDDGEPRPFLNHAVQGLAPAFLDAQAIPLRLRAAGYDTDADVWQALADNPNLAVMPASVSAPEDPFANQGIDHPFRLEPRRDGFEPFALEVRSSGGEQTHTITVIGQVDEAPSILFPGILVRLDLFETIFGSNQAQSVFLGLAEGVDSRDFARDLEAGMQTASVESLDALLEEQQALQSGFLLVFQGFMGLGLIVGIAALGVVASRSVVERRQQIGMLRAIGYKRSMVALTFIFESTFIALSGILLGLILGLALAWTLFATGDIGEEAEGVDFVVPWVQVLTISGIAFGASLLMTFLPARNASRVAVAEALRYE